MAIRRMSYGLPKHKAESWELVTDPDGWGHIFSPHPMSYLQPSLDRVSGSYQTYLERQCWYMRLL